MVVTRVKHGEVKLQDLGGQGTVVRVEFAPESGAARGLEIGDRAGVRGQVLYNRRGRMEQIIRDAFPGLTPGPHEASIALPGIPGKHANPLKIYPQILSSILKGRRSCVHGDLHLRNVLVDEWGRAWLIDFARVEKRHNLFDFIKLETYVRLRALAHDDLTFSLDEYVQFEEALAATILGEGGTTCPDNDHLQFAYKVILAIRDIARKYMGREPDFRKEFFPALFLYCLAMIKYYQEDSPRPTRLAYATATVLGRYLS
jgi:hypothetical protein